jgi:hypothetical protein
MYILPFLGFLLESMHLERVYLLLLPYTRKLKYFQTYASFRLEGYRKVLLTICFHCAFDLQYC